MQIWIYFLPGAGGDGLANLLEQAQNVETVDSDSDPKRWRVHRYVDNQPKFYASYPDSSRCFRNNRPFLLSDNKLRSNYVRLIENNINTVCTSHDVFKKCLHSSDSRDILERDQVSVFLYHPDYRFSVYQAALKNLEPTLPPLNNDVVFPTRHKIDYTQFDFVLDITEIQSDWRVVERFCNEVGIALPLEKYQQYLAFQDGNDSWYNYSAFRPKKFQSQTNNGVTTYTEI